MSVFTKKFGWVLVLTVLLLFLFPLHWGSFTQTHGPTTAMRALVSAQCLFAAMALLISFAINLIALSWFSRAEPFVAAEASRSTSLQLRC